MARGDPLVVERRSLDNGLTLTCQPPPPGAPSVAFTYFGPGGTAFDPADREGLALLDSEISTVAAGARDRRALARHLDALGATLSSDPSPECTEFAVWGPAGRWKELLDVLADAVRRPRFDPVDVATARTQLLERQLREATQPDSRADVALLQSIYPSDHPYYRSGVGTRASVGRIRRDDLRRFHRTHFGTRNAHVVATSTVPIGRLAKEIERRFPESPEDPGVPPGRGSGPRPSPTSEVEITMPGRSQVDLRLGTAAVARSDPAFPALFLGNEVLGGRVLLSRLFQRIRERSGLAYHTSSELEAMAWGGFWIARAGTGPERAAEVERLLKAEIARLRERPIPPAELDRIRESLIGSIQLVLETTAGVHDFAVEVAYYGLEPDFFRRWPERLRAIRPSEITRAVGEVLRPESSVMVRAGP